MLFLFGSFCCLGNNNMNKQYTLLSVIVLLGTSAYAANAKSVKVFIMAGQSNMDGQADIRTIDFLGEDKDPARAALLKTFKPDGKNFMTRDDVWVAYRGFHYYGEGRFFILLGKAFADTMLELTGHGGKVLPPKLNTFAPPK